MKQNPFKACVIKAGLAAAALLLACGAAMAQSAVTLTAGPTSATLPDGQSVPMWGYTCGAVSGTGVSCMAANGQPQTGGWQPPLITVPSGQPLTITLVNGLSFGWTYTDSAGTVTTGTNNLPTSLTIVGQLGGGLGLPPQRMASPIHAPQGATWPGTLGPVSALVSTITVTYGGSGYAVNDPVAITGGGGSGATAEVASVDGSGAVTGVTVTNQGSGYTSEPSLSFGGSGSGATGRVNLATSQSADSPTFVGPAQIDRVRSFATEVNVSDSYTDSTGATVPGKQLTWSSLRPGTYLIESGTEPSIQGPMGLYGVLVVTDDANLYPYSNSLPAGLTAPYDSDVSLLWSEIDPVQNREVAAVVQNHYFQDPAHATYVWNGGKGACGDVSVSSDQHWCYPPAINYSPRYYLVNGVSFDRTNMSASSLGVATTTTATDAGVLVRFVNAGLRVHVPSLVGTSMSLVAEDGFTQPGAPRQQNEVVLPAGKTADVIIHPAQASPATTPASYAAATIPVYDRTLDLSTDNEHDGGMQAYINVAGGAASGVGSSASGTSLSASDKSYTCIAGTTLSITDPSMGLLAGSVGANGVTLGATVTGDFATTTASLTLNSNGTFTYVPTPGTTCGGSFDFVVNGSTSFTATITQCDANAQGSGCTLAGAPVAGPIQFTSNVASRYVSAPPGVLAGVTSNPNNLALTAVLPSATSGVTLNSDGSFVVTSAAPAVTCPATTPALPTGTACVGFSYQAKNAEGTLSNTANATVILLPASNLAVNIYDAPSLKPGKTPALISDYRWIIEEDKTFYVDPKCQVNSTDPAVRPASCPPLPVESLAYSFHTSNMPVVAQGCVGPVSCESGQTVLDPTTGGHVPAVCDVGNGACRTDATQMAQVLPGAVHLDPTKRYYISILPGDAGNPTIGGAGGPMPVDSTNPDGPQRPFDIVKDCGAYADTGPTGAWAPNGPDALCGHTMGGAEIAAAPVDSTGTVLPRPPVKIGLQEQPLPTSKISVFVFQDDNPLNGENDAGGGVDVIAPNEAGLGGFNLTVFDQAGLLGDATGQITYDQFNEPVSNALSGHIDPLTGLDACPITQPADAIVGTIPTCPKYESDGTTLSPLAGQAIIANLYPGLYEVVATPAAARIARGEEWLQTSTLDGTKPIEAFLKPGEPGYFQEFGPGGYHVMIGFANPQIINDRRTNAAGTGMCDAASGGGGGLTCNGALNVQVTSTRMSRTPDQRLYSSGSYDAYSYTQCYVTVGQPDAEDFAFQKCDQNGRVSFTNLPTGDYKLTVFDQWNDIMLDGLVSPVTIAPAPTDGSPVAYKEFPVTQWRTDLYTRTFIDQNGNGISDPGEPGLTQVNTNLRYRDGSIGFFNSTDNAGYASFNEVFPFMDWLVAETSLTRYKPTGEHVIYDAGGPADGSTLPDGTPCDSSTVSPCGDSSMAAFLANTVEHNSVPDNLRVPGAVYCGNADCTGKTIQGGTASSDASCTTDPTSGVTSCSSQLSSGRIDPPLPWGSAEGWQGMLGQDSFIEFGEKPFMSNENGGITGQVIYASTRPFDDPSLELQLSWEPGVPHVKINLYQETTAADGTKRLKLVDTTTSASWDDWAQGFHTDASGNTVPNMNCPGQDPSSPFFETLKGSTQWLDASKRALPNNSQFKCYDGWAMLNQIQPAPYDGYYKFPSVTATDPTTGKPSATNCTICTPNPDPNDGSPMLPPGKYVVEAVTPPGFEIVKEEDKNILLGDVFIAPVTQQFAGFGNIFIMPDQASLNAYYNQNNPGDLNLTTSLGAVPRHEGDTGSVEAFWPCVGAERIVPDLISLYPGAQQAAPFAGATRKLCDRKEVTLEDQMSALAKFYVFTSTHIAGHFTGTITNDFSSEFDPFSPQFGEKFGPPNLPVAMRDYYGDEVARVYSDQWGVYDGLYFSSWTVNPPNPTGYAPQMAIFCMNDPGPVQVGTDPSGNPVMGTDPAYNPAYSDFCYETPFMPGDTSYLDTPVIPTQGFADQYNLPDSEYPDETPAILKVVNSEPSMPQGPWVQPGSPGSSATAAFTIGNVPQATTYTPEVVVGGVMIAASIQCLGTRNNQPCGSNNNRDGHMAALVADAISSNSATTGYKATSDNSGTVTIASVAITDALNGTPVVVNLPSGSPLTISPSTTLALAGGAAPATAAMNITITALGDKVVQNPAYSGPNASTAPFNEKTIMRHYGFGSCTPSGATSGPCTVTITNPHGAPVALGGVSWSDTAISAFVPNGVCPPPQQAAGCSGELVITGANGKRSIDTVTVTVGGKTPTVVSPTSASSTTFGQTFPNPLQTAIDNANPGDLILVEPGTYRENLIMWKPVRLQGVGAESVTINADAHPSGKMDPWRRQIDCVFGLTLEGRPNLGNVPSAFDPSGTYTCPGNMFHTVDRIPLEGILGWDTSTNGNLAQLLQEPTLMGAYEGAGITVLGRGVWIPTDSTDFWGMSIGEAAFPAGSRELTAGDCSDSSADPDRNYQTSNYLCHSSRIDGVSVINSSQGGGGIFIHGWNHHLEVANTRIYGNQGTLAGGINIGNGETPPLYVNDGTCGTAAATFCPPFGADSLIGAGTPAAGGAIPFQLNVYVHVHNNEIINNASIGDALFSGTPSGAGGVSISAGADRYVIEHNWIAGNLSTGDGGGISHQGLSFFGTIAHNFLLFNQSTNPTLPTDGGAIAITGANADRMLPNGLECGSVTDVDCPPGIGDGAGPGLVIDANLMMGNSAESGSGGGLTLKQINGEEVGAFNTDPSQWYDATITNNIIANNVAGWDGGGVSMQDALKVMFVNNTVVSNDTTATAGVLFKTLGAINASSPPPGCTPTPDPTNPQNQNCLQSDAPHDPQPAGLVTEMNTPNLQQLMPASVACPAGFHYESSGSLVGGLCRYLSLPVLTNDMFWQNRAFRVDIIGMGTGVQSQQNLIALSPQLNQLSTGQCSSTDASGAALPSTFYWDVGIRQDDLFSAAINGTLLTLSHSVLTNTTSADVTDGTDVVAGGSPVVAQYCNGARIPPEACAGTTAFQNPSCRGYNAPAGRSETTGLSTVFVFNGITPAATVDEGHNWLNLTYGPLSLSRPSESASSAAELMVASPDVGVTGGAYSIPSTGSAALNAGTSAGAPSTDFFGNPRPSTTPTQTTTTVDAGAVQVSQ